MLPKRRRRQALLLGATILLVLWHYASRSLLTTSRTINSTTRKTSADLKRKGNCWYEPTPFDMCVEGGELFLFGSDKDEVENVNLCVGYPQQKPEGTFVKLHHKRRESDQLGSMFDSSKNVQLDVEFRIGYFITTTLETNLFHIIRDNLANIADMIESRGGSYGDGRVFLLPKNPRLSHINNDRFHFLFSALTGVQYESPSSTDSLVAPLSSIPQGHRVCFKRAYLGQSFSGYSNGPVGRLIPVATAVRKAYNLVSVRPPVRLRSSKLKMVMIKRSPDGIVDRTIGNLDEIQKLSERMDFISRAAILQEYTVVDQMTIASQADVVLGAHGQGLSWCMFLSVNSVCLELQIWNDKRSDYRLLSKWSKVHNVIVTLTNPSQVSFQKIDFTDAQKMALKYYRPISNLVHRQYQTIYPNMTEIEMSLVKTKALLYGEIVEKFD